LQEADRLEERRVFHSHAKLDIREELAQIALEGERETGVVIPLEARFVKGDTAHVIGNRRKLPGIE